MSKKKKSITRKNISKKKNLKNSHKKASKSVNFKKKISKISKEIEKSSSRVIKDNCKLIKKKRKAIKNWIVKTNKQASILKKKFKKKLLKKYKQFSFWKKKLFKRKKKTKLNLSKKFQKHFSKQLLSIYFSVFFTLAIIGGSWWIYSNIFKDLPNPTELTERPQILTTRILDRNANLLFRVYEDENRTAVSLNQISQHMINATIAIEDKDFYKHQGFSPKGIIRAIWTNLNYDRVEGGSTVTQQLVKNRLVGSERTIQRKIRELILSILVEGTYSKEEILQMYLNQVPYGGSTYGVEEAAWRYFNKSAKELSLAESSLLAGLPAAPSVYTPFGSNPELGERRQEEVLRRMMEDGYITIEEAYQAKQEEIEFRKDMIDIQAPHFVMYVKKLLADMFGEEVLNQGGLEVRTSLDLNLQQLTQSAVTQEVDKVHQLRISNGAALVTNPQTGEILAMVGSRDYFDFENDGQVNVALRPRQPGSSIKPLVYALAFESGKKPWDAVDDSPITYQIPGSRPYSPRNYDGTFRGKVTLRQALASSLNVPAVKTLAGLGVDKMVEQGQQMGISTWADSSRFGLSLALGAGEVLMTDLSELYGTFANGGYTVKLDPLLEVRDSKGELLYRNACFDNPDSCKQTQTISQLTAYQITDILSDNIARTPTFGSFSLLYIPQQEVAVKTGTTNSMRDNWTIGYTSNRLVATWVGNNDNTPMSYVASGMTGASPIWNQIMRQLLDENNSHQFELPEGLIRVSICASTRTLPCRECPLIVEEVFVEGSQPTTACSWKNFPKKTETEKQSPPGERSNIL